MSAQTGTLQTDPYNGPPGIVDVGGRLYGDLTGFVRSTWSRTSLSRSMQVYGPRVSNVVECALADRRFSAQPGLPFRAGAALAVSLRVAPAAIAEITRAVARPQAARARAFHGLQKVQRQTRPPEGLATAAEPLRFAEQVQKPFTEPAIAGIVWPLAAGILVSRLSAAILKGIATGTELTTALGCLPHNVTTEMDLALWRLASDSQTNTATCY